MRALLDTCALLWWWSEPERIRPRSIALLRDPANEFFVSAASAWEVSTKHRIGKYPQGAQIVAAWSERLIVDRFRELAISSNHALRAGALPGAHRDPFDRMIAAQSILEQLPVITPDSAIASLGAETLW